MDACRAVAQQVLHVYASALGTAPGGFGLGSVPCLRLSANSYPAMAAA